MKGRGQEDEVHRICHTLVGTPGIVTDQWNDIEPTYRTYRHTNYLYSAFGYLSSQYGGPPVLRSMFYQYFAPNEIAAECNWADIIVVEHPWQFRTVERMAPDSIPVVYSSHNVETDMYKSVDLPLVNNLIYRCVRNIERYAVQNSDLVVTTTTADADRFGELFGRNDGFHVALNGTQIPETNTEERYRVGETQVCVFVGSDHPPNRNAARHLIKIAQNGSVREADIEFAIVGSVCNGIEETPENVTLEGFVDDLTPFLAQCDIGLNPVTTGGGSNVKLAKYFAHQLPVVTTPFGARGFPTDACIVDDIDSFGDALVEVAANERVRTALSSKARTVAETQLRWQQISEELFEQLRSLI